ncbi:MAG TPA: CDP-glucose 4,6-dehydratase [Solirubrobacteraceae bacterium]|nr:CDP-glucose 4,6-dehydratase [Solirubrobacteraceae bacterium]
MTRRLVDPDFWRGRSVFVTGHTGFKGAWLSLWLQSMGAHVTGFADEVPTTPSLFELARVGDRLIDVRGDVRDHEAVLDAVAGHAPEIVIHMAAQPFVRRSFLDPRATYETNVMGTVNVLEAVRATPSVRVVVNVTSDKCYDNDPSRPDRPFVEDDPKGGHDPYSNSKGCAELVADAYLRSFFGAGATAPDGPRLGSARAGNVIGGGDWGEQRLIPDIMRGALDGAPIAVRNPEAVRPWQHVLNPLSGYLLLAQRLEGSAACQGGWNFGPALDDAQPVRTLADRLTELWPGDLRWQLDPGPHPHEARYLALDSTKAREQLGWRPTWDLDEALARIVAWYAALRDGADMQAVTLEQIAAFEAADLAA